MRIVNVTAYRRPFSYAATGEGGCELDSGACGPEIPLARIFDNPLIIKDIEGKVAQVRLSEDDRTQLARIQTEGERKITVAKKPTKPKPKSKPKSKSKSAAKKAAAKPEVPAADPVTQDQVDKGQVSLADLQLGNTAINAASTPEEKECKLKEIQTHMGGPMGSMLGGGAK